MKQFFTFLLMIVFAVSINAQYIYNDYDANQNVEFFGWPNMPVTIANPDASGINTSANVAEWERSTEQYANVYTNVLPGTIDFSTGTTFSLKVWSPIACDVLFKLEGNGAPVERLQSISTPNTWVQLDFDFTGEASGTFNKVVFFLDFATFTTNTFYYDDIEGPEFNAGPAATLTLPVTFDDPDAEYDLIDFGGTMSEIVADPEDADNMVAKTIKMDNAEFWAGTTVGGTLGFVDPIPFTIDSTLMGLVVWSPDAGIPVRLKVENAANGGIFCETDALTTIAMAWDTLIFDFSNPAPGTPALNLANEYNKASVFFNFGTSGGDAGEKTYYWDYMYFAGAPAPKPLMELDIQDNFENDGWGTVNEWFFQDPDMNPMTTTADPDNGSNTVADYNRTGAFPYTNAQFVLDHRIDLTARNKFELDVYFPSSNDYSGALTMGAAIKLQNSKLGGNAWMTQTEIIVTTSGTDQWETLLFDFSAIADSVNYDQVVIQLGGEAHNVPAQFYFDNLYLKHVPYITIEAPNGGEEIEEFSSYLIEWDFNYWDGDIDILVMKGDNDPEEIVFGIPASDSSYQWSLANDLEPGDDYRIILTSIDGFANDTSDAYFTITEMPLIQAGFEADTTMLLAGGEVMFTNMSAGDIDSWMWTFEGGTPETFDGEEPPMITYENVGMFDVTLVVSYGNITDTMFMEEYIHVGMAPSANFEASETQILVGETVDFMNMSEGEGISYEWMFEGGDPSESMDENPSGIMYSAFGDYDVTLIATNAFGADTMVMTDYIMVSTVGIITYDANDFQVYPNPATTELNIELPKDISSEVYLMNLSGQTITALENQHGLVQMNTSALKAGIYMLLIRNADSGQVIAKKVIIN